MPAVEELGGLRVAEPELLRAELDDVGLRPEPAEPQWRVGLARDDDVGMRREPGKEVAEVPVDRRLGDLVVVVEDDRERRPHAGELVDDDGQDLVGEGHAGGAQPASRGARKLGRGVADGGHEIGPEADRVVVAPVDRVPRDPRRGLRGPLGEGARLARPGGSGHDRETATASVLDHARERGSRHQPLSRRGDEPLGPHRHEVFPCVRRAADSSASLRAHQRWGSRPSGDAPGSSSGPSRRAARRSARRRCPSPAWRGRTRPGACGRAVRNASRCARRRRR